MAREAQIIQEMARMEETALLAAYSLRMAVRAEEVVPVALLDLVEPHLPEVLPANEAHPTRTIRTIAQALEVAQFSESEAIVLRPLQTEVLEAQVRDTEEEERLEETLVWVELPGGQALEVSSS